jgi:hypothetical protein
MTAWVRVVSGTALCGREKMDLSSREDWLFDELQKPKS